MTVLEINNLSTGYDDVPVLTNIDIKAENNEIVGIIGPNGAGKSTIFKAIMGYIDPWEGEINFQDSLINNYQASDLVKMGLGYVPQRNNVFPRMTVMENLRMGAFTIDDEQFQQNKKEVLELFPRLSDRKEQTVRTMSGGERKMVAIARALITKPELVLFDEPSAGLMPKYVDEVFEKIHQIRDSSDISFIIIEQNVQKLLENTDRTYVIRDGEVRLEEISREILESEDLGKIYLGGSDS